MLLLLLRLPAGLGANGAKKGAAAERHRARGEARGEGSLLPTSTGGGTAAAAAFALLANLLLPPLMGRAAQGGSLKASRDPSYEFGTVPNASRSYSFSTEPHDPTVSVAGGREQYRNR